MYNLDNNFQLIIPIGGSCINSYNLRRLNLQLQAFPFDWVGNVTLNLAVNYLQNHFTNYLVEGELKLTENPGNPNTFSMPSGIMFVHDFHSHNINAEFEAISEKYKRRIARVYDEINKSKSVLFVHCCGVRMQKEDICSEHFRLTKIFPGKKIKLLYIYMGEDVEDFRFISKSEAVDMAELNHQESYTWKGNRQFFDGILKEYRLKSKTSELKAYKNILIKKFMKLSVTLFCCCLPCKKARHSVKEWYRYRFEYFSFN